MSNHEMSKEEFERQFGGNLRELEKKFPALFSMPISGLAADVQSQARNPGPNANAPDAVAGLIYIADSPPPEQGGFHPNAVATAKAALVLIEQQRHDIAFLKHQLADAKAKNEKADTLEEAMQQKRINVRLPADVIQDLNALKPAPSLSGNPA